MEPLLFRPILPDFVALAETDPRSVDPHQLDPQEWALVSRSIEKRRREFAAGRLLARSLLGSKVIPLLIEPTRAPRWPEGICGSVTHCSQLAAVALCEAGRVAGLGIDVEPAAPLPDGTASLVLSPYEVGWLAALDAEHRELMQRVVFSGKEAFYKAQHARSRTLLDFSAVQIDAAADGAFRATLVQDVPHYPYGTVFHGRYRIAHGFIATAVIIDTGR